MDTKVYRIPEYHKMVSRIVMEETCKDLFGDIRSLVGDFIIAIASGLVYAIWSYVRQDTIIDWIGVIVSVICGFFAWAIVLFLCNLWKTPAKLYRKKEAQATLPSWEDIEIKEFEFPPTSGFGIGLEIISHKPECEYMGNVRDPYIDNVIPKLARVSKGGDVRNFPLDNSSALPIMQGNTTFERFSHIQSVKDLARDKRKYNVISIAKWDNEKAWITLGTINNEKPVYLDQGKTYSIEIEIRDANVSPPDVKMNYFRIKCNLLYGERGDGKKNVSIKIESRYPEYEKN